MTERIFYYATWDRLSDWLACGWLVWRPNAAMHHHCYGVVVERVCECGKMRRPLRCPA